MLYIPHNCYKNIHIQSNMFELLGMRTICQMVYSVRAQYENHLKVVSCLLYHSRSPKSVCAYRRKSVGDAMIDYLRRMPPNISSIVQRKLGDAAVLRIKGFKAWNEETWPQRNVYS